MLEETATPTRLSFWLCQRMPRSYRNQLMHETQAMLMPYMVQVLLQDNVLECTCSTDAFQMQSRVHQSAFGWPQMLRRLEQQHHCHWFVQTLDDDQRRWYQPHDEKVRFLLCAGSDCTNIGIRQ